MKASYVKGLHVTKLCAKELCIKELRLVSRVVCEKATSENLMLCVTVPWVKNEKTKNSNSNNNNNNN